MSKKERPILFKPEMLSWKDESSWKAEKMPKPVRGIGEESGVYRLTA
jgi:hypothetical protein